MKAREPKPDIAMALTVEQFCQMFCITPELYAALRRNHSGPSEVRVGECIVTPLEYAAQWGVDAEPLRLLAQRWLCHLDLDRLRAFGDARLVLFASLNPSKETGTARTNFLRAPPWDAIKPKP